MIRYALCQEKLILSGSREDTLIENASLNDLEGFTRELSIRNSRIGSAKVLSSPSMELKGSSIEAGDFTVETLPPATHEVSATVSDCRVIGCLRISSEASQSPVWLLRVTGGGVRGQSSKHTTMDCDLRSLKVAAGAFEIVGSDISTIELREWRVPVNAGTWGMIQRSYIKNLKLEGGREPRESRTAHRVVIEASEIQNLHVQGARVSLVFQGSPCPSPKTVVIQDSLVVLPDVSFCETLLVQGSSVLQDDPTSIYTRIRIAREGRLTGLLAGGQNLVFTCGTGSRVTLTDCEVQGVHFIVEAGATLTLENSRLDGRCDIVCNARGTVLGGHVERQPCHEEGLRLDALKVKNLTLPNGYLIEGENL